MSLDVIKGDYMNYKLRTFNIFDNVKKYYPDEWNKSVDAERISEHELILTMEEGPSLSYCDLDNSIRPIPMIDYERFVSKDDFAKEFGIRLRRIMKLYKITQVQLAEKVGVDVTVISKYVRGLSCPSAHRTCMIAWALGCDLSELIYY